MKRTIKRTFFLAAAFASILACSHTGPVVQDYPVTSSANDEVAKFYTDVNAALVNQVDVLAPESFDEANNFLKKAQTNLNKQKSDKSTLHYVAQGRAYLNRANNFATLSHNNIEEVIIARKQAITAGADNFFAKDFNNVDKSLMGVTSDIENNKLNEAIKNKSALQLKYLDLELKAIKHVNLEQAKETVAQAVKEGAGKFAPRSLAIANKDIQDVEAFITANRKETQQIAIRSSVAVESAMKLLRITKSSKYGDKTSSEEIAIQMDKQQIKVANQQNELNYQENQIEKDQAQLKKAAKNSQALNAENMELQAEQSFNKQFEEARGEFNKSEAEVYKQGNTLAIRLKGLEFSSGKAELKNSNFPLLAKVQEIIKNFGSSTVIVEGHTDSIGGAELNNRLSSDRAKTVKEYLLTNSDNQSLKIEAVGYGFQKPLATNKTLSGRAQNRRVDVLITPVPTY